ncbi:hypothetical protein SKP52_09745 [Sphingopyxis fribergensis]|uniref:Uncharacterized protein n=1 Tax=Sphingopyxis fribergensis TaxID=1515612 RepID=A0A0A7PFF1_9SPHN|nr:hypothetical protein [Sphingopyxis fribergensis]AJA08856.1 hypothetical protein SKP52_09745 [Sphingopyxis fribergensis]
MTMPVGRRPVRAGDRLYFRGYSVPIDYEILEKGQIVAVAEVREDGEYVVFPIDDWGRVYSQEGETVFSDEVVPLPMPPIPIRRFPPPYGQRDNEGRFREATRFLG